MQCQWEKTCPYGGLQEDMLCNGNVDELSLLLLLPLSHGAVLLVASGCGLSAMNVTGPKDAVVCPDSTAVRLNYTVSSGRQGVPVTRVSAFLIAAGVPNNCTVTPSTNGK